MALWNLSRLATALTPLFKDTETLEEALNSYEDNFWKRYYEMMGNKLGLDMVTDSDKKMISKLEEVLATVKPDMTIFYRLLINLPSFSAEGGKLFEYFKPAYYTEPSAI
ncbi:protein adenylyltransferase SelO family protein [Antarcticibacterium arcticum]|nr:protein adenylyltransferase SelO family protein [Antarcticibacterium arcticum]